jgi:hypothetical protein
MKSSWITALTIVGVLGTATAAMAINADTLKGIDGGTIGNAIEVLVPVVSSNENPDSGSVPGSSTTPTEQDPTSTTSPESSSSASPSPRSVAPAPKVPAAVVPNTSPSAGTSGSSGSDDAEESSGGEDSSDDDADDDSDESESSESSDDD